MKDPLSLRMLRLAREEKAPKTVRSRVLAAVGAVGLMPSAYAMLVKVGATVLLGGTLAVVYSASFDRAPRTTPHPVPQVLAPTVPSPSPTSISPVAPSEVIAEVVAPVVAATAARVPPAKPASSGVVTRPLAKGESTSSAELAPEGASLADEVRLLDRARRAVAGGDAARAFEALSDFDRASPRPRLAEEAEALRIEALVLAGRTSAAHRGYVLFASRHPTSPQIAHLARLVGEGPL